jgi:hypothetical protein
VTVCTPASTRIATSGDASCSFADPGGNQLGRYGFDDAADSIRNRRNLDTLLYEHWDGNSGAGDRYCYDSQTVHSSLGGFGDDASTLTNSSSDTYWC